MVCIGPDRKRTEPYRWCCGYVWLDSGDDGAAVLAVFGHGGVAVMRNAPALRGILRHFRHVGLRPQGFDCRRIGAGCRCPGLIARDDGHRKNDRKVKEDARHDADHVCELPSESFLLP